MTYHHGNLRKALLERAAAVIAEQGVEGLSLRGLAQDLGVSHAAPSRHFRDRVDLLRTLATEGHETLGRYTFAASSQPDADPLEHLAALGRAYVRFSLEHPAYYRTGRHPEVAAQADDALKEAYGKRMEALLRATHAAQAAGWRRDAPALHAMIFGLAAVRGLAALLHDPLFCSQIGDVDPGALIEGVMRLVIDPAAERAAAPAPAETGAASGVAAGGPDDARRAAS